MQDTRLKPCQFVSQASCLSYLVDALLTLCILQLGEDLLFCRGFLPLMAELSFRAVVQTSVEMRPRGRKHKRGKTNHYFFIFLLETLQSICGVLAQVPYYNPRASLLFPLSAPLLFCWLMPGSLQRLHSTCLLCSLLGVLGSSQVSFPYLLSHPVKDYQGSLTGTPISPPLGFYFFFFFQVQQRENYVVQILINIFLKYGLEVCSKYSKTNFGILKQGPE